jgi:hypothetical protein
MLDFVPDGNVTATLRKVAEIGDCSDEVKSVLRDSAPVLLQMVLEYGTSDMLLRFLRPGKESLTTKYAHLLSMQLMFRIEGRCFLVASWTLTGSGATVRTLLTPRMVLRPTTITSTIATE